MAITINNDDIRQVRSKLKVSPEAFERELPEGLTMEHVQALDTYRADYLETAIRASDNMVADTLIGTEERTKFNSATVVVPMGETTANVVVKPHKDTGVVGVQIKADTVLTGKSEGILAGTDYLTQLVQKRMAAENQ